jgi:hypothetical protein
LVFMFFSFAIYLRQAACHSGCTLPSVLVFVHNPFC